METRISTRIPKMEFKNLLKDPKWKNVHGVADKDNCKVILHNKINQRNLLEVLIHEHIHCAFYDASEYAVQRIAGTIADRLWELGYRRVK